MSDPFWRRVVSGEEPGGLGVGTPQHLLRQPDGQLFSHQRVAEPVAAAHTFEHPRGLGLPERLLNARGARERRELRLREAIVDHGERGQQSLAEPLEPLEPPRHNLTQARSRP